MKRVTSRNLSEALEPRRLLATYTVTSIADTTAAGTLRLALMQANSSLGVADTIQFAIGSGAKSIALTSSLPAIVDTVTFNATSQPGYSGTPLIEINGGGLGTFGIAFDVVLGTATFRGMVINRFGSAGIRVTSNGRIDVKNCYLGTNAAGTAALPNGNGVDLETSNNVIGGTLASERNLISGNNNSGVYVGSGSGNVISGNYIGTNAVGTVALPNYTGVSVYASQTTIGGEAQGSGNLISGNGYSGITAGNASSLKIQQNRIGTNASGTDELINQFFGVSFLNVTGSLIGGTATSAGTTPAGRNTFLAGYGAAIHLTAGSGNSILGNRFGLASNGMDFLFGGGGDSIEVASSNSNAIGSTANGAGNVFGDAGANSVYLRGDSSTNTIEANQFGLPGGPVSAQVGPQGVLIEGIGYGNRVGGTTPAQRNVFMNLNGAGVRVQNHDAGGTIAGNIMGSDATLTSIAPMDSGVILDGTTGWVVSHNDLLNNNYGAQLLATSREAFANRFIANRIGGDHTLNMGNFDDGILIDLVNGGASNEVTSEGGTATIAHNGGAGIRIVRGKGIRISWHEIFDNGDKGIVLNGANGANNNLAAPVITRAVRNSQGGSWIEGTVTGTPNGNYILNLYANDVMHPSGYGEGQHLLTTTSLVCNASGIGTFKHIMSGYPLGTTFTALLSSNSTRDTSEFSLPRATVFGGQPVATSINFEFESNHTLRVKFDQNVAASLTSSDLQLTDLVTGRLVTGAFFLTSVASSGTTQITTATWTFFNTNLLRDGAYRAYIPTASVTNADGDQLASSVLLGFHVLAGDLNRDHVVNFDDLLMMAQNYGQRGRTFSQGNIDYSGDGAVTFDDLLLLAQRYGTGSELYTSSKSSAVRRKLSATHGLL
jgi:titin